MSKADKKVVTIKKYKVPIERDENNKVKETMVDFKPDMLVDEEEVEIDGSIFLKLPALGKKVGAYNKRQITIANNDLARDYIYKRIITK